MTLLEEAKAAENILNAKEEFKNELAQIKSENVKRFVLDCFGRHTAPYFWTIPASTPGKHHPFVDLGTKGLVRHTKFAVWWGIQLFNMFTLPDLMLDYIIAALLLHDIRKNGDALDEQGNRLNKDVLFTHGGDLRDRILEDRYLTTSSYYKIIDIITSAIAGHMGKWTGGGYESHANFYNFNINEPNRIISFIVHLANYVSSRKVDKKMKSLETEKMYMEEDK